MIFIKKVWKELRKKRESSNTNIWCVLGDFNSVKMPDVYIFGLLDENAKSIELGDFEPH